MKDQFPGFTKKSNKELSELWENGLITIDTNVLLDLYRYSKDTRDAILSLIKKLDNKIFFTYQSILEYNKNRYEVISEQEKTYKLFVEKIDQIDNELSAKNHPPFLSTKLHNSLSKVFGAVKDEVNSNIISIQLMETDDEIYNSLNDIIAGKIIKKFSEKELLEIYKEGKSRYEKKIPPGYMDNKKPEHEKYGDLILWKEILQKSSEEKKPIIFISNEKKEDWIWKLKNGKTIGPRQELIEEMVEQNGMDFHLYSSSHFLKYGQEYLNQKINEDALEEMEFFKKANELNTEDLIELSNRLVKKLQDEQEKLFEILEPVEADIIRLHNGYGNSDSMSYKEIGETFEMDPNYVKYLKEKGLRKILHFQKQNQGN